MNEIEWSRFEICASEFCETWKGEVNPHKVWGLMGIKNTYNWRKNTERLFIDFLAIIRHMESRKCLRLFGQTLDISS
jgi:hypothetical protein